MIGKNWKIIGGCLVQCGGHNLPPLDLNRVNVFSKLEYLFVYYEFVNSVSSSGLKVQTVLVNVSDSDDVMPTSLIAVENKIIVLNN